MVALALTSVAVAGLLIHRAADAEVAQFGVQDLQQTANRIALTAGLEYQDHGGWTPAVFDAILPGEKQEDHVVAFLDLNGRPLAGDIEKIPPNSRGAPVEVNDRRVGTVIVGHPKGGFLKVGRGRTTQRLDAELTSELDRRLVEGAVVAGVLALLLGLTLAFRVTQPLQRITMAARRMARGQIEARATGHGGSREAQELAQTLDRLAAALRRQDELRRATAADVTHELRNALVGVVGRLEALQDGLYPDEKAALERTLDDARRVYQLVDDVRLLAEAQRPSLLVRKQPVDLDEICSERLAAFADRFEQSDIALEADLAPARVEGDPERLDQIVDNLLSNALRYTDPGGRVVVRVDARGQQGVVEVADTGIGIAPEYVERVFDRFWRAPESRGRVAGSGVGLALVRDLVLAHDGTVDVRTTPGEGSTFTVRVPLVATSRLDVHARRDVAAAGVAAEPLGDRGAVTN